MFLLTLTKIHSHSLLEIQPQSSPTRPSLLGEWPAAGQMAANQMQTSLTPSTATSLIPVCVIHTDLEHSILRRGIFMVSGSYHFFHTARYITIIIAYIPANHIIAPSTIHGQSVSAVEFSW